MQKTSWMFFACLMHAQFTPCVPEDNKYDIIEFGSLMQTEKKEILVLCNTLGICNP